jgi:hypothetical protein
MRKIAERLNKSAPPAGAYCRADYCYCSTVIYHFAVTCRTEADGGEIYKLHRLRQYAAARGEKKLLAQLTDGSIKLYIRRDYIILEHNGNETEFSDWNKNFASTKPQLEYYDLNHNVNKDIVILAQDDKDNI